MDWALVFSDETVGYVADFTTVLVNGGIIGAAIYAYARRREFLEWLRKAYAALLALIAELRAANELAGVKAAPAPAAPAPSPSDQGKPVSQPVQQPPPLPPPPPRPPSPPPAPQAAAARSASKQSKEPSATRPTLAWGIGAAVGAFILVVALLRAWSTPAPVVAPQPPVVASSPASPQPPALAPPSPREAWSYTVQPNESCWAIAERAEPDPAKTGQLWASIVALNPMLCSARRHHVLRPGSVILIPPTVQPAALAQ